jgi:hypothetical protein
MKRFVTLLLLAASTAVMAESGVYRVEVIVFRNLSTTAEASTAPELRSFSAFPDLQDDTVAGPSVNPTAELPPDENGVLRSDLSDDVRPVNGKSSTMDGVWRRLRSSQTYQPLIYAAWEQNRVDYFPPIRIHDLQVIDTQLRPPTQIVVADLTAPDPLAAYRSTFYQLDGSLQLRRSRFLHLFLDLEFRDQNQHAGIGAELPDVSGNGIGTLDGADTTGAYRIYALNQNRQISTGELQYFDTPYYGALVYVTAIP